MDKKYASAPCPKCSQEGIAITIDGSTVVKCRSCSLMFEGDRAIPFTSHVKGNDVYDEMSAQLDAIGVASCVDYLWFKDAIALMRMRGAEEAREMQSACIAAIDNMRTILAAGERARAKAPAEVTNG